MLNEMDAYMAKLAEIDYEIKILYNDHFNINTNTTSAFNIYPKEEQIAQYGITEQIEQYAQHVAFWTKLKDKYDCGNTLIQMITPRTQYIMRKYNNIRMDAYINLKHNKTATDKMKKKVTEILNLTTATAINGE